MTLPDPKTLSAFDLRPERTIEILEAHKGGAPLSQLTEIEDIWLRECQQLSVGFIYLVTDMPVYEILKKTKFRKHLRPGAPSEILFTLAAFDVFYRGRDRMDVYRTDVLPALIQRGSIPLTPSGEPDPYMEGVERQRYIAFMDRQSKKRR